jgi:hypothetical protein
VIAAALAWLTGTGGRALARQLARAMLDVQDAKTDAARIAAEVEVERIRAEMAARADVAATRRALAGQWEMRLLVLVTGLPLSLHLGAVALDSALPDLFPGWVVAALPAPMDEWQGRILLSLFGLSAVSRVMGALRR